MAVRKSDFFEWKNSDVTKVCYDDVREAAESVAARLLNRIATDHEQDAWDRGFIRGIQSVLEWEPEFEEDKGTLQ